MLEFFNNTKYLHIIIVVLVILLVALFVTRPHPQKAKTEDFKATSIDEYVASINNDPSNL